MTAMSAHLFRAEGRICLTIACLLTGFVTGEAQQLRRVNLIER
jgi:hypothetical protein